VAAASVRFEDVLTVDSGDSNPDSETEYRLVVSVSRFEPERGGTVSGGHYRHRTETNWPCNGMESQPV